MVNTTQLVLKLGAKRGVLNRALVICGRFQKEGDRALLSSVVEETGTEHTAQEDRGMAKG